MDARIEIDAPAGGITISGGGSKSNFSVIQVQANTTATLNGLKIENGNFADGGGIDCNGNLTVTNCNITQNTGSGIFNNTGNLTVTNCTFSANTAQYGSAIYNCGVVTVSGTALSGSAAIYNRGANACVDFMVTSSNGSSTVVGSLPWAVAQANALTAGEAAIDFDPSLFGQTIVLSSALTLNSTVAIRGVPSVNVSLNLLVNSPSDSAAVVGSLRGRLLRQMWTSPAVLFRSRLTQAFGDKQSPWVVRWRSRTIPGQSQLTLDRA